jgi:omega-amidase
MDLNVALAQMAITPGQPGKNIETATAWATQAAAGGAHLLVLPELWPTGYDLAQAVRSAAALDAGPFAVMANLARAHRLHVVGTALEANPGSAPFNTAALFGPGGDLLGAYRKVHLFPPLGETEHMSAGANLPVFDLPWGRTALAICYDLRFPEMWQRYTEAGAQLIVIPAEWPVRRIEHWRLLLRARAVENQLFVLGCNRAGSAADGDYGGCSAAVDPWGQVLMEGSAEPGLFLTTLHLEEVPRCRRLFPFLDDRQPEVYGRESHV